MLSFMGLHDNKEKRKRALIVLSIVIVVTIIGLFLLAKYFSYFAPFIIALIISSLIEPVVRLMTQKLRLPRRLAALISIIIVVFIFTMFIMASVTKLISEIENLSNSLPHYYKIVYENLEDIIEKGSNYYYDLPEETTEIIKNQSSHLLDWLRQSANMLLKLVYDTALFIPQIILFLIFTILASFFISSDKYKIRNYFKTQFPEAWTKTVSGVLHNVFLGLVGYLRSLTIIMIVTFTILFISFTIIGIRQTLLLSFIGAVFEALPILGTGTIIFPWMAYLFIVGNYKLAISLLIVYLIVFIVRQLIEPKILSTQIGVHPLITLAAMYFGFRTFGFAGLLAAPIMVVIAANIFKGALGEKNLREYFS